MTAAGRESAVAETLAAHDVWIVTAKWTGSPNPADSKNIWPTCRGCRERLIDDADLWHVDQVNAALRAHVAAAVLAALDQPAPGADERRR